MLVPYNRSFSPIGAVYLYCCPLRKPPYKAVSRPVGTGPLSVEVDGLSRPFAMGGVEMRFCMSCRRWIRDEPGQLSLHADSATHRRAARVVALAASAAVQSGGDM